MRNLHNLGLFSSMGGPFDRVFFELSVIDDDLEPKRITDLVGVDATVSYKKGDETPSGSQYRKTGAWILKSGEIKLSEDDYGDVTFLNWIKNLPNNNVWKELKSKYVVELSLIGYTHQMNSDFKLTSEIMFELSSRGLDLKIEPFLSLEDDEE